MKKNKYGYLFLGMALILGVAFWPASQARAQSSSDTLMVPWSKDGIYPVVDTLRDVIAADTNADGTRKHKVYELQKGGFYWITDVINNNGFPLNIVGQKPDPADPVYGNPAVIQMHIVNSTNPSGHIFAGQSSLTLKNVWILGDDDAGSQGYYEPMDLTGSNNKYVFDGDIFSRSDFAITAFDGVNNDITFTNCKFRNMTGNNTTQQWTGRAISVWASQDSVIIENNTFFNCQYTAFQLEGGYANYIRFNHNTIVDMGRQIESSNKKQEYFANNLIINGFYDGEGHADLTSPGRLPSQQSTGIFTVGLLPSEYGLESSRKILLANTYMYRDPKFSPSGFYGDSIHVQPLVNDSSAYFFRTYSGIVAKDTVWLNSAPAGMPTSTFSGTFADSLWNQINDIRTGAAAASNTFYRLPMSKGNVSWSSVSWPLPEDFSYTDQTLMKAGTDGLPIGDLNWFPQEKQTFEANKAQYVKQIESMVSAPTFNQITSIEAENGTLSGDASVYVPKGFKSFYMTTAGDIKWNFNLAKAGTYKLVVQTNMDGNSSRGENIYVNGTNLQNRALDGAFHFDGANVSDFNSWVDVTITTDTLKIAGASALTMPAGQNTLEIKKSWGYQYFSSVFIEDAQGNVVDTLKAEDATYSGLQAVIQGAAYTPSNFKEVELGANGKTGSISWNVDSLADGTYLANIFYQAPNGNATADLSVNGSTAQSGINLAGNDSTGHNVQTSLFTIRNGKIVTQSTPTAMLTLSSSTPVLIDYMQLYAQQTTAIQRNPSAEVPNGFSLDQNYPNPFNPTTNIRFKIPSASNVHLAVYNVLGQKVATLVDNHMSAGVHVVQFNASQLSSGLYFYRLRAGNFVMNKKMMLIK